MIGIDLFEQGIFNWIVGIRGTELTITMLFFTELVSYMVLALIILYFFLRKEKELAFNFLIAMGISLGFVFALKAIIARPRPYEKIPVGVVGAEGSSFPSGHSSRAFIFARFFHEHYKKLIIIWYAIAIITAFSRIYLGVHYVTDVIAGSLIGFIVSHLVIKYNLYARIRKVIKVEKKQFAHFS